MPRRIEQWMYPINKTDLDVLRSRTFWRWRRSPCASCQWTGRIEVALAATADPVRPALAGDFLPRRIPGVRRAFRSGEISGGAGLHFIVSISGILIMSGAAWVFSWYKHSADKSASRTKSTGGNADMAGGG